MHEQKEQYINPITGKPVDKYLKEKDAKEQGYFDFQFMLRYLEDENEFVKFYIVDGVSVLVDMDKPNLQYKKKSNLNYERTLQATEQKKEAGIVPDLVSAPSCNIDDEGCISCSG